MEPNELRHLVERVAAKAGCIPATCPTCFGSCVSRVPHGRSPTGFVVSDPCATCHGGGRLWADGRSVRTWTDLDLLDEAGKRPAGFALTARFEDAYQRLEAVVASGLALPLLASRENAFAYCDLILEAPNAVRIVVPRDQPISVALEIQAYITEELLAPPPGGRFVRRASDSDVPWEALE